MKLTHNLAIIVFLSAPSAHADEVRLHLAAGAAHAFGPPQGREFGAGGGATGTVEYAVGNLWGVQASGGALVLAEGKAPSDASVAQKSTGTAGFGTAGVRFRPLGASRVGGPWIDANGGMSQTGNQMRVVVDSHVGWDFRVGQGRWDVGPFVGYTQILQPNDSLRGDDARIAWAGLAISIGASDPHRASTSLPSSPAPEAAPPPASPRESEPAAAASTLGDELREPEVKLVGDRIVLDDVIHFEFDSPRIRSSSAWLVRRVAQFITTNSDILEVSIEGHSDAIGSDEYNLRLSEARAESTRAMLVHFGADATRLKIVGFGKSRPRVDTAKAEPRNRRVEFVTKRAHMADMGSGPISYTIEQ